MDYYDLFIQELVKYSPKFIGSALLLGLGWVIGKRITHYWNYRKSKQELDLEASKNFQSLYGEFFEIWKLWNYYSRDVGKENFPEDLWWKVMDRACIAEGRLEALMVSITCEKHLTKDEIENLGMFRQGYQQLRESIRDYKPLNWNSSKDPEYVMFKNLSPRIQALIIRDSVNPPSPSVAATQLKEITSNFWETEWAKLKN